MMAKLPERKTIYYTNGSMDESVGLTLGVAVVNAETGDLISGLENFRNTYKFNEVSQEEYERLSKEKFQSVGIVNEKGLAAMQEISAATKALRKRDRAAREKFKAEYFQELAKRNASVDEYDEDAVEKKFRDSNADEAKKIREEMNRINMKFAGIKEKKRNASA